MIEVVVVLAIVLVGLVAGLLFGFAVVAMPGIKNLGDGEFIRAFQVMDKVIQDNQPVFMVTWLGSVLAVIAAAVLGFVDLDDGSTTGLLVLAAVLYLAGVQVPTASINIPLNNRLQEVNVADGDAMSLKAERDVFEGRWNRWNRFRATAATATMLLLALALLRL